MKLEPRHLDANTLKALYDKHLQELSDALLSGAEWKDVQDKRNLLIELTKQLYQRGINHPAEYSNRTS